MKKIKQVLLVDDNEEDNEYHELVINKTGVEVKTHSITHPVEALECWQKGCETKDEDKIPDLVFLDINMPKLNGFELLDKIRKVADPLNRIKQTKIFILSTSTRPQDFIKSVEGYDDLVMGYYSKPLTGKMFLEILDQYF